MIDRDEAMARHMNLISEARSDLKSAEAQRVWLPVGIVLATQARAWFLGVQMTFSYEILSIFAAIVAYGLFEIRCSVVRSNIRSLMASKPFDIA